MARIYWSVFQTLWTYIVYNTTDVYVHYYWTTVGLLDLIGPDSRWYGLKLVTIQSSGIYKYMYVHDYLWKRSAVLLLVWTQDGMDLNVTKVYLHYFPWSRYGLTGYLCLYMITSGISKLDFISPDSSYLCVCNDYLWSRSAGLYWCGFLGWGCGPHTGMFLYPSPLCCGSSGSRPSAWPLGCLVGPPLY